MRNSCELDSKSKLSGFIGYEQIKKKQGEIIRIYLNCKDKTHFEHAVDVCFFKGKKSIEFQGLTELSAIKKFNRFIGCLEERAREENLPRERVFESADQLLYFLRRVKNSRAF